jgi:hypothetical protein
MKVEGTNRLVIVVIPASLRPAVAQQKTCDKPYQISRFVDLGPEYLRVDRARAITKSGQTNRVKLRLPVMAS